MYMSEGLASTAAAADRVRFPALACDRVAVTHAWSVVLPVYSGFLLHKWSWNANTSALMNGSISSLSF